MNSPNFSTQVRPLFDRVADHLLGQLQAGEEATLNLTAEDSLFVRFTGNRVRQNTDVTQIQLAVRLQSQGRTVEQARNLSGVMETDYAAMTALLANCRAEIAVLPTDPNQVPMVNNGTSAEEFKGVLLATQDVVNAVVTAAEGCDLVGLYCSGTMLRGNRNSKGQSHWFATDSFFLDYSLYDGAKAAKGSYAGSHWDATAWAANLAQTRLLLQRLGQPLQDVKAGKYRTYLAPRAFSELLGMLGWNALSAAAWKQGRSPFKKLAEGEVSLSPLLCISENFGLGLMPRFNSLGEVSATTLPLIEQGVLKNLLVSSRSAKEYGLKANAATETEAPRAMDVAPGVLAAEDVLKTLGTGLYLSNLHYLNWSDQVSARVTGMTRYACLWVEGGEIRGPINNLRWDESLFDALGPNLLALTCQVEIDPAVETYYQRALGGSRTPGALIADFTFTL